MSPVDQKQCMEGLHMIIYYHCPRDSVVAFIFTNLPSLLPSLNGFYTCSTTFSEIYVLPCELSYAHVQKMTKPLTQT